MRVRLDALLVERGLAPTRSKAQALLMAGAVRVDGVVQTKAGTRVAADCTLHIDAPLPYVSRGGYKLAHALDTFGLSPQGRVALDAGASTGGFTDVLLQRGAVAVYAIDVGYGLLDWRLRHDARVVLLERTNVRHLAALPPLTAETSTPSTPSIIEANHESGDAMPPRAQCGTIDVSFISLRLVLPAVQRLITGDAWVVALIKPQFEAGPHDVGRGGVVRDARVHRSVLAAVLGEAEALGFGVGGLTRSPITGPAGNIEFLAWLTLAESASCCAIDIDQAIDGVC